MSEVEGDMSIVYRQGKTGGQVPDAVGRKRLAFVCVRDWL